MHFKISSLLGAGYSLAWAVISLERPLVSGHA